MKEYVKKGLVMLLVICLFLTSAPELALLANAADSVTQVTISDVTATSAHVSWPVTYLNDANTDGSTFWSTGDDLATSVNLTATLSEATNVSYINLYPRVSSGAAAQFPANFSVQVSQDGATWDTVIKYAQYKHADTSDSLQPLQIWIDRADVKYVRLSIAKGEMEYVQLAEVQVFSPLTWNDEKDSLVEVPIAKTESSSAHSHWNKSYLTDGAIGGTFWTNNDDVRYIAATITNTFALQGNMNVQYIDIYQRTYNGTFPTDFSVAVSEDGSTWTQVASYNNYTHEDAWKPLRISVDKDNIKYAKVVIEKPADTQYVQLAEVKIYSKKTVEQLNISGIEATSAHVSWPDDYMIDNSTDGSKFWSTGDDKVTSVTVTATLEEKSNVSYLKLWPRVNSGAAGCFPANFKVQVSEDGTNWTEVIAYAQYKHADTSDSLQPLYIYIQRGDVKYIKLDITKSATEYIQLAEFQAFSESPWNIDDNFLKEATISSLVTSSEHSYWNSSYLTDGAIGGTFWTNNDSDRYVAATISNTFTLTESSYVQYIDVYQRTYNGVFPSNFAVSVSEDGETWTEIANCTNYTHAEAWKPLRLSVSMDNIKYAKVVIEKPANTQYVQLAEVKIYSLMTAEEIAETLTVATDSANGNKLVFSYVPSLYDMTVASVTPSGIVADDYSFTRPEEDTEITLTINITNSTNETDTAQVQRTLLIKSQATLENEAVAEVAKGIDFITCPGAYDTKVTLPTLDGYTITIAESDHPEIVDTDGNITRSDDTTYGVYLTLNVKNNVTGAVGKTEPLLVPIYKTYVVPTMTEAEIEQSHEDYESKSYGIFIHYVSQLTKYIDGTTVENVDDAAKYFDVEQFAKDMNDCGAEYVMLTAWHANMVSLFPSMANQRWRDDRRASEGVKSYSDRDVIAELIEELDKYGIELYLYTHPSDGHDFTTEDQELTGWNDSTGNYATWNNYVNELYYELCERYGDKINCLWFDGVYNHVRGEENQQRLRRTCLSFNPGMNLVMNVGFEEGNLNPLPAYTHPDYRCWEVNRVVDFENDMKYSRYQSAIVIGGAGWWATKAQSVENANVQSSESIFRYLVAMASISTHGGFAASTGYYPARETDEMNGDYWMEGIREALLGVNEYLNLVAESIKNTNIGKAYPTTENQTVSDLEWGVSTESRDGKNVYIHVLNAPYGQTLTLPAPADGSIFNATAQVLNFDGTTTDVTVTKSGDGYVITLPSGTSWSEVDTVIKLTRSETEFEDYSVVSYTRQEANEYIGTKAPTLTKNGEEYLFAGWYTDIRCGEEHAVKSKVDDDVVVYAKFVSAEVLKVLCQVKNGTTSSSDSTDMRLISSVDSLNYQSVGFVVMHDEDGETVTRSNKTSTVYEMIASNTEGNEYEFGSKTVGSDSEYFITATCRGIEDFNTEYYVRAFWVTYDGTIVYGAGRYVKVSDSYNNLISVPAKASSKAAAKALTVNDGAATISEVRYRDGEEYANLMVSVSDVTKLPSATKYTVSDGTSMIYRNYYTTYSGTADTSWYTADTDADEYVLVTAADLYGLASLSASNTFAGKTIYLASDIELNKGTASATGWTADEDGGTDYAWTCIGTSSKYFSGIFDGQGHVISGLYYDGTDMNCGMFAYTAPTSVIRNFTLENSYITDTNICVGSIVGQFAGTMDTVKSTAYVSVGNAIVGGLIGYVYDNSTTAILGKATINNCWFDGEITSGAQAGGIVGTIHGRTGYISEDVTITNCLYTGKLTSTASGNVDLGGIVGTAWGGILRMTDCLSVGEISTSSTSWNGSVLGRYRSGVANTTAYIDRVFATTENSTNGTVNIQSTTDTTVLKQVVTTIDEADITGMDAYNNMALDYTSYWTITPDGTPILTDFGDTVEGLKCSQTWMNRVQGTAEEPYELTDINDLYGFAFLTTQMNFVGKTIVLNADMDLTGLAWSPIGTSSLPFAGTFDGQGHTIKGINIETSNTYIGFFGMTATDSTIKNFRIEESSFTQTGNANNYAFMGSAVGELRGNMENVYSSAILTSDGIHVGGLIGRANGVNATTISIKECWFDGTVAMTGSTGRYAAGIVGSAVQGTINITDCLFSGTVSCEATDTGLHIGGFIGCEMNGLVANLTNCLSAGTIDVDYAVCVGSVLARIQTTASEYNLTNVYATTECYPTAVYNTCGKAPNGTVNTVLESTLYGEAGAALLGNAWTAVENDIPVLKSLAK